MNKEIVMNPDILPTQKEWRLICKMVKQQRELTDEEIKKVWSNLKCSRSDALELIFARAILKKASKK
jgi:Asp-tRNA(Asn)/Glu-tRNA(Gln) amidotransferase B subunit